VIGTYSVGNSPGGIAIDGSGNVWVANYGDNTVTVLSSSGALIATYSVGSHPAGIAVT
jgi:YVTN family beta-propeller protein